MSVPSFADLGKSARDVFTTGYHYGKSLMKLTGKAGSGGVQVDSDLRLYFDDSKLSGAAHVEYNTNEYGIFRQQWSTDGTMMLGYTVNGFPISSMGLLSELSYNPATVAGAIKCGLKCNQENVNAVCSISSDFNSNINVLGSIVTAIKGLMIGYQGGYSTETNRMTKNDIGMTYLYHDVGLHFRCVSIPNEYGLSLLYKVNSDWDAAINGILARTGGMQKWTLGTGAKCQIDDRSTFRCKFNTDLQLGMSMQHRLDPHVLLTLSFNVDCSNMTRGGHKVGLALELEG
ncbi:non-selective voltage-gated ion channel VDAC2-like [Osmia lignaria lignaria]|uniref:non-selective voltage-gated ion channel VDAC2-like n=1 Tax=Osmia lignaria lignaria TaxID=1437193 RepID=UPI0014784516|nr:voltage-dependent anion-selective channel protein 2-like [Osmia lignaria]XP_034183618.1 voltage-dependent anion-selective channel protein 2-like [Osmia lignaria]